MVPVPVDPSSRGGEGQPGAWLFRHRGWLPVVPVLVVVALGRPSLLSWSLGLAVLGVGEGIRLWALRTIGPKSRTRDATVGLLETGGPYRFTRNPLYVGNVILYAGLALVSAHGSGGVLVGLVMVHYHFIVAWEEARLEATHGPSYRAYQDAVPRWVGRWRTLPATPVHSSQEPGGLGGWRATLRTERGTLLVLASVLGALWVRSLILP